MSFTLTFVSLLIASTLIRLWLGGRQINYVQARRNHVPEAFSDHITLDVHQKAADYTSAKTKLALTEVVVQSILLATLTLGGLLQLIDDSWRNVLASQEIIRGVLVICSAMLISSLIDLPFEYYKTFVVDQHLRRHPRHQILRCENIQ